jgi:uncharacterized protein YbgA (DUF1722 family)/uncharacterized protein YbbK (DUF523 family)
MIPARQAADAEGLPARHATPIVVLSKCLEQEACRYNGQVIRDDFVRNLEPFVRYLATCPEVEIGLGVPRDPIRLVRIGGTTRLIQPSTDRDLTQAMRAFADAYLGSLGAVDGFILKNRSPSCGLKDVKVHAEGGEGLATGRGAGLFGEQVMDRFGHLAVEDEARLKNPQIRHHFLTRLFAFASFRAIETKPAMRDIVAYHSTNKLLFMAHNQTGMARLGEVVANHDRRGVRDVAAAYRDELGRVLARPARPNAWVNVAQHAFGYISDALSTREKVFFGTLLDEYRAGRQPLQSVSSILAGWLARLDVPYLEAQTLFEPYPSRLFRLEHR